MIAFKRSKSISEEELQCPRLRGKISAAQRWPWNLLLAGHDLLLKPVACRIRHMLQQAQGPPPPSPTHNTPPSTPYLGEDVVHVGHHPSCVPQREVAGSPRRDQLAVHLFMQIRIGWEMRSSCHRTCFAMGQTPAECRQVSLTPISLSLFWCLPPPSAHPWCHQQTTNPKPQTSSSFLTDSRYPFARHTAHRAPLPGHTLPGRPPSNSV